MGRVHVPHPQLQPSNEEFMGFNERLEKALARKNLIREDQTPRTGIWYYLWLKPRWKLWTFPYVDVKKAYSHYEVWQALAEDVGRHYKLTERQVSDLQELPYCFPRGRVDTSDILATNELGEPNTRSDQWFLLHGNDFPLSKDGEIKKIISLFNLVGPATRDMVKELVVDHEKMVPDHVAKASVILGGYQVP